VGKKKANFWTWRADIIVSCQKDFSGHEQAWFFIQRVPPKLSRSLSYEANGHFHLLCAQGFSGIPFIGQPIRHECNMPPYPRLQASRALGFPRGFNGKSSPVEYMPRGTARLTRVQYRPKIPKTSGIQISRRSKLQACRSAQNPRLSGAQGCRGFRVGAYLAPLSTDGGTARPTRGYHSRAPAQTPSTKHRQTRCCPAQ
jgi:hypothetical protein